MTRKYHPDLRTVPVQKQPCKTCPFAGERSASLRDDRYVELIENLMGNGQHFCHSVDDRMICRGGRDIQLRWLCSQGFLESPTDEAFDRAMNEVLGYVNE